MRWMEIAWAQEGAGVAEIGGARAHKSIVAYFHGVGRPDITSDEVPWCAAAAFWCLEQAGISIKHIPPAERLLAVSGLKIGTAIPGPRVGALCIMKRPGGHHIGFVTKWTDTTVTLLGGNQRDSFCEATFKRQPGMQFRWPAPAVTPKDLDAEGSRIAAAAARQKKDAAKGIGVEALPHPSVPDASPATAPIGVMPPADPGAFPSPADLASQASATQTLTDQLMSFVTFAAGKWQWLILGVAIYYGARVAYDAWRIRCWRAEDASTGKTSASGRLAEGVSDALHDARVSDALTEDGDGVGA